MNQKYRMLKTVKGVHDGHLHPTTFNEGEVHPIGENLAGQFIELGVVDLADEDGDAGAEGEADGEAKSKGGAPSNKMKKAAPENKSK